MKKSSGFTLIEILVALMIFSILATITSSTLFNAFNTRNRINLQARRLTSLQLALTVIQQDSVQAIARRIRSKDLSVFPEFIGLTNYLEFTRDGYINPQAMEKRSSLKRVALICKNNQLVHRTWESLDMIDRHHYEDKVLLNNLTDCHFNYLNQNLQVLHEWRVQALDQDKNKEAELLPKAIQVNVKLNDWGEMNLLFILTGATYVSS